jgi:hypothetical protein
MMGWACDASEERTSIQNSGEGALRKPMRCMWDEVKMQLRETN